MNRIVRVMGLAALTAIVPTLASAHGPDPLFGTRTWNANQVVGYSWAGGSVPPSWMANAIDAGAADVAESRNSRAAAFARTSNAPSTIAYGPNACVSYAIACVDRTGVPASFAGMWFRPHGWPYDWGVLRWCQSPGSATDGCFDAETIALDELGHVEILGHHVNYSDGSDYTDAVVQATSHARPSAGWNQHRFGACDVARLQLEYARQAAADLVSNCLALSTQTSLSASPTSAYGGSTISFSATLRIALDTASRALSGDWLSRRQILLQRRLPGATAWSTITTMTASGSTDGVYGASWPATATYEWRASFTTPGGEGLYGSTSATVTVTVGGCMTRCPSTMRQ